MRACLAVVLGLAAAVPADACPVVVDRPHVVWEGYDLVSGGPAVARIRADEHPYWTVIRAVPVRPSLYFHPRADRDAPLFVDQAGTPLPNKRVATGIGWYPWRYDFALESGTIYVANWPEVRFAIDPGFTPHTRHVTKEHRMGLVEVGLDTDAALLRFEQGGESWVIASELRHGLHFDADVRVTAIYADRTEELLLPGPALVEPEEAEPDHRLDLLALVLLGALALVGRAALRHQRVSKPSVP